MIDVRKTLDDRAEEYSVFLRSQMMFGDPWTNAATHDQRLHRLDHLATGFPWIYEDGPEGFSKEHPFGHDS